MNQVKAQARWANTRWWAALGLAGLGLASQVPPASAASLIHDVPQLQKAFAALLAGSYSGSACAAIPDREGRGMRPGRLLLAPNGAITLTPVGMNMFDPSAEFSMGRHYGGASNPPGYYYQLAHGGQRLSLNSQLDGQQGFVELGAAVGQMNVTDGQMCADLVTTRLPLMQKDDPLRSLVAAVFDTGGQTVEGPCRNLGPKRGGRRAGGETRRASFRVGPEWVELNGQALPLRDTRRPLAEAQLGSRYSDGTLNGGFTWVDGSGLHIERFFGDGRVATFSFSEGEARWTCRPG